MNIAELSSFSLRDNARFRDTLNPVLWNKREHLKSGIRNQLLSVAEEFAQFSGVLKENISDIVIAGSQAAYSYTPQSDIDVFVLTDFSKSSPVFRELVESQSRDFSKKLRLGESRVFLNVVDINTNSTAQGIYSLVTESWVQVPRRAAARTDDLSAQTKITELARQINIAVESRDRTQIRNITKRIDRLKTISENYYGRFSSESLALVSLQESREFDLLSQVQQQFIRDDRNERRAVHEFDLTYGYNKIDEDVSASPDGVAASTHMFLSETDPVDPEEIVRDFVAFCRERLGLQRETVLRIKRDPAWPGRNKTFGHYNPNNNELTIALTGRHIMDILRTTAHEMIHQRQFELQEMPDEAGETGSEWENEANAGAGILMRDYGRDHPEFFGISPLVGSEELDESASGYIPTKKQARDPRYSMALTVDIKPGALGKNANKLKLNTDSQGRPQVANPNGKFDAS